MVRKALHVLCFLLFLQVRARGKFCDTHKHTPLMALAFKYIFHGKAVQWSCGTTFYVLPMNSDRNAEEPNLKKVTKASLSRDQKIRISFLSQNGEKRNLLFLIIFVSSLLQKRKNFPKGNIFQDVAQFSSGQH